jgi:uncharacterized protein (DUF362 family)
MAISNPACRQSTVGVIRVAQAQYPKEAPYHPAVIYPEYPFPGYHSSEPNLVYDGVRELLHTLELDAEHWNKPDWNPLGELIKPGMTIVIKPNFVLSRHFDGKDVYAIITHPAVLRAISDYCWIALKGSGKIIIADAPQYNCNFGELIDITRLDVVCDFYRRFAGAVVDLLDLRNYWSKTRHFPSCILSLPGDPKGSLIINLGKESALYNFPNVSKLYGAVFHRQETIKHHSGEKQEYEISNTILNADVLISVPKLKVHKKVGVTLNQKGLVGISTNKNLLVHYTLGSPSEGGDQYPDDLLTTREHMAIKFERWMYDHFLAKRTHIHELIHRFIYGFLYLRIFSHFGFGISPEKRLKDTGNWYGNDSAWRMVVDLAKVINFADKEGNLQKNPPRRIFSVIDGIVSGENNGPLNPDPKYSGVLIGGDNLLAVDIVATRLMGFDPNKLKQFTMLDSNYDFGPRKLEDIEIKSNWPEVINDINNPQNRFLSIMPHPGWIGHIEI